MPAVLAARIAIPTAVPNRRFEVTPAETASKNQGSRNSKLAGTNGADIQWLAPKYAIAVTNKLTDNHSRRSRIPAAKSHRYGSARANVTGSSHNGIASPNAKEYTQ